MKIGVFIVVYNEENILPHALEHYFKFCDDVYILNNHSTDNSINIANSFGCKNIDWGKDEIDEHSYLEIKNNCYKPFRHLYDYIIVCDCDEFLYHDNIKDYIEQTKFDIYKSNGFEMIYDNFDYKNNKTTNVCFGSRSNSFDKCLLFKSNIDIQYDVGCHTIRNHFTSSQLQLRHMKYLNIDFVKTRYAELSKRNSESNIRNGWAFHYSWEMSKIEQYYESLKNNLEVLEWKM